MSNVLAVCSNKKAILVQELLQLHVVGKTDRDTTNNKSFLMLVG